MSYQGRVQPLSELPEVMSPESSRRLIRKPGNVLRDIREVCGVAVSGVSTGTGIPLPRWIAFECGEGTPNAAELEKISEFFEADLEELVALFRPL